MKKRKMYLLYIALAFLVLLMVAAIPHYYIPNTGHINLTVCDIRADYSYGLPIDKEDQHFQYYTRRAMKEDRMTKGDWVEYATNPMDFAHYSVSLQIENTSDNTVTYDVSIHSDKTGVWPLGGFLSVKDSCDMKPGTIIRPDVFYIRVKKTTLDELGENSTIEDIGLYVEYYTRLGPFFIRHRDYF